MDISDTTWEYAKDRAAGLVQDTWDFDPDRGKLHDFMLNLLAVLTELGVVRADPE
jgi:hypothetical protein